VPRMLHQRIQILSHRRSLCVGSRPVCQEQYFHLIPITNEKIRYPF
jgi:hypothetical protein